MVLRPLDAIENKRSLTDNSINSDGIKRQKTKKLNGKQKSTSTAAAAAVAAAKIDQLRRKQWKSLGR